MPVQHGKLHVPDFTKIQENYNELADELDGKHLVNAMFAAKVFTLDDKQEIEHKDTRVERTEVFLQKLLYSGPKKAYGAFLRALKLHYPHLHEKLTVEVNVSEEGGDFSKEEKQGEQSSQEEAKPLKFTSAPKIINILGNHKSCKRDHTTFIQFLDFSIEHLPDEYRLQEVYDYIIHSLGEQTVYVVGGLVSEKRPEGYFLWDKSGTKSSKSQRGSGRLRAVLRKFEISDGKECPCNTCIGASSHERQWGEYLITCPMHVIYNDEECNSATFRIGYDTNQSQRLELNGYSLMSSDMSLNVSNIKCVTHDPKTCRKIESMCHRNDMCREKLLTQSHLLENKPKIAVLVSHPHGEPKHVSIGEWVVGNDNLPHSSYRHAYTTAACPVSAGGPVLLLGDTLPCVTMHRRAVPQKGVNQSNGKIWSL